jgi:methionyl-tRNA synthetase
MAEGTVPFNEFKKLNLVVGTVASVEPHPNADKLYVLKVDLGEAEPRTLVAGLKPYYEADDLQGKQLVVVANLEPANLRGVESRGMLLAAQEGETVVVISPEKPLAPGSRVL